MKKLDICSKALVLLGAEPISSFDDKSTESLVSATLYDTTVKQLINAHPWKFAKFQKILPKLTTNPIENSFYKNAFLIPTDFNRMITASASYDIYGEWFTSDVNELTIEYLRNLTYENFPIHFETVLIYKLAGAFAIPITGDTTRANYYNSLGDVELRKARAIDGQSVPAQQLPQGSYTLRG